jgi:asparagine synthase (glutamine-hydrolysing)
VCGIAGFTHGNRVFSSSHIRSAVRALIHRGPDQQGIFESHHVSLGAVRLKIIDLAGGDQPMISEDGDIVVAFNGEIYNHGELRAELLARGCSFISNSDTEVVLQAFREWDIGCFRRFRGMFAVALWTESQKRLVLARDRMGIKPLFFHRTGSDILFGSEIKAILEHPAVERKINPDALNCFLSLNYVPAPHTMIDGIEKLLPGHFIEWVDGRTQMDAYWVPVCGPRKWVLEDAEQELDSLLRQSVREHLISDVPLGIWLSGGLDSSTLVHYAAELGARVKTFSITFKGRSFDESRYIEEVSQRYGTEHSEFDLNTDVDLTGAVERFAYYSDEPCADAGALPVWFLAKECRKHVTVALSGEGADELFGGYLTYFADRYSRWFRQVPSQLRRAGWSVLRRWPVSDEKISLEYKLKRFFQGSFMPPEQAHVFWNGTFNEQEKSRFFLETDSRPLRTLLSQMPKQDGLNRYLAFDLQFYLPDDILCKVDRMSMAHSLEVRPPFLDHRICEFALSLPEDFKIRRSQLKFLLRVSMRHKLPASILRRKKIGFDIPAHDWLRGALKPLLLDTVTENTVRETGFRWLGIEAILKEHLNREANWGYHLWGLMILLLWMKQWKIHQADLSSSRPHPPSSSVALKVFHIDG